MIKHSTIFLVQLVLFLPANSSFAESAAAVITLQADNFEHISFSRIKANHYTYQQQQLNIAVDNSASFLMKPFDAVKKVNRVSIVWRSEGRPKQKAALHEKKRTGDDAVFKLGLLLKTDDVLFKPFLPAWMKRVEQLLRFPSKNMIYLVVGARNIPGEQWQNPYSKNVTMIAIDSIADEQGWQHSSYRFEMPLDVVALWLMADGDDTGSRFSVKVKAIRIE